eukprot:357723-Chlamydomonas_euryale.AAC.15
MCQGGGLSRARIAGVESRGDMDSMAMFTPRVVRRLPRARTFDAAADSLQHTCNSGGAAERTWCEVDLHCASTGRSTCAAHVLVVVGPHGQAHMRSSSPCGGGPTSRREHLVQEAAKRVGALRGDARVAGQAAAAVVARYAASGDLSEQGHRQAPELVHVCSRRRQCSAAERLRQEARAPTSVRVQVVQRGVAKRSVTARLQGESMEWRAGLLNRDWTGAEHQE